MSLNSFQPPKHFAITENKAGKRIDISIDGKPFTSYIYPDSLMKSVLYPIRTSKGTLITRGWPMDPRPGERIDHPHHVGMWFNYGNVNGLDFWNNSTAIPADKKNEYGTIKHISVDKTKSTDNSAELDVTKAWLAPDGRQLLTEKTKYLFTAPGGQRAIEMITTLTALKEDVSFADNKEGVLGIRLARELEHPSDKPEKFTDANGIATEVAKLNNEGVTGKYRSSEGIEGDNVWATRGKWVNLNGSIGDEPVSLVVLDNPKNVGYPTYWHARDYGLFAANPLGQEVFSNGKEKLNLTLKPGESVTFRYRMLITTNETVVPETLNQQASAFSKIY
ncbi:MAG: hypothetical protein EOO02_12220 [Chitinophagaceae bacterium]|nr:MAG: hypothetical protein EOO02_12220 [Chitinophagaceae bacterium]